MSPSLYAGGLLTFKLGMTSIYHEGKNISVTVLHVPKNVVMSLKTQNKNSYTAVQLGVKKKKPQLLNKAEKGYFSKLKIEPLAHLREFRVSDHSHLKVGEEVGVSAFQVGETVNVVGTSKGKGFQGVFKRHGFAGGRSSRGSRFHRVTGSIGNRAQPGRVFRGKRMPGHMGNEQVTCLNLTVMDIDQNRELLVVKGAVPGPISSLVQVRKVS